MSVIAMKLIWTDEELPQGSEEWLEKRTNVIGGSDVSKVLFINSSFDDPKGLWELKTGRRPPVELNDAMRRGTELEPIARQRLAEELPFDTDIVPMFALHPTNKKIGISFDGVDVDNKFIVEIKCPSSNRMLKKILEERVIPDYYYCQVQLQLYMAQEHWGIEEAIFCVYYPEGVKVIDHETYTSETRTFGYVVIKLDEDYVEDMLTMIDIFYEMWQTDNWEESYYYKTLDFNKTWVLQ